MLRDAILEFRACPFPFFPSWLLIAEKRSQDIGDLLKTRQAGVEDSLSILIQDRAIGRLEENVPPRVAQAELLLDLLVEIVGSVLGLPKAVPEIELIE